MSRMKKIWYHPWLVAVCNILLLMVLYTLSRLFCYAINQDIFTDLSATHLSEILLGGMRFDLTAILYLSSLYLVLQLLPLPWRQNGVYQTVARYSLWIPNALGLLVNTADMVYLRFTNRRTTCTFFSEFENDDNLLLILLESVVQYWYVSLFAIALVVLMVWLTRRKVITCYPATTQGRVVYYTSQTLVLCLSVYFIVIGIRGGFGRYTRPITISNAMQYVDRPEETALVLNTPFSLMKSIEIETYHDPAYLPSESLSEVFEPLHRPDSALLQPRQMNVVVLILESFSREFVGYLNHDAYHEPVVSYTPFLDSLLACSRTFTRSLASGRKSIDAMPSVLSSIPMLIEPYVVTPYSTNEVMSLASCLRQEGYTTAFYHGAPNGSMGFEAYARSAGFERYMGMNEYDGPDAFDGTWAIWDEEFLLFYARSMTTLPEPFFTTVFTASSHHPFRVPDRYEGLFPKGTQPLHQCIGYSDNALRRFFALAKQQPWYDNTLFVFTADHTNSLSLPQYTNAKGLFEIPIAFFMPDNSLAGHDDKLVSQTDIMPSVLAWLGYDKPYIAFGDDVLTTKKKRHEYVVNYNAPVYQVFSDSLLLQFDGQQTTALYNYLADPCLRQNILDEQANLQTETDEMLLYLKAYIQQYITRMINNDLTISEDGRESR